MRLLENKKGIIAEKTGFYIIYIFLFFFAVLYAAYNLHYQLSFKLDTSEIDDSIVANKVLSCFCNEKLGELSSEKLDLYKNSPNEFLKCYPAKKYGIIVYIDKELILDFSEGFEKLREVKRYVLVDGNGKIFKINYKGEQDAA